MFTFERSKWVKDNEASNEPWPGTYRRTLMTESFKVRMLVPR